MTKNTPPRPAMKATPMVSMDRYQMPFMYSGRPIKAPRFQFSTPVLKLM